MKGKTLYVGWTDWFNNDDYIYSLDYNKCKAALKECYDAERDFDDELPDDFEVALDEGIYLGIITHELI